METDNVRATIHPGNAGGIGFVAIGLALGLLSGCGQQNSTSWYDESKTYDQMRQERIDTLVGQGMATTQAEREVDIEASIRLTERGTGVKPLEGSELNNTIRRGDDGHH